MIILGIILLIIGFVASIPILWTIGIIVLVIGLVLALMGMAGRTAWAADGTITEAPSLHNARALLWTAGELRTGSSRRIVRGAKNKAFGRVLARTGIWRTLWK
jgi:hypothetical protein